jgi:NAD(P)-dependent dehydrogenase (short-subunit alcohol dehydrogenase family)
MECEGKVAVITGGSSGIGRGIAVAMAKAGADIVVAGLNDQRLDEVCQEIKKLNRRALGVHCDVSKDADVDNLAASALSTMGKVDILVNNAGVGLRGYMEDLRMEDWQWVLGINLLGTVRSTRAFLPHMLERESGYIVFVCSYAALNPSIPPEIAAPNVAYCTSKIGMTGMAESLFSYLRPKGISVSIVYPNWVATDMAFHNRHIGKGGKEIIKSTEDRQKEKDMFFSQPEVVQPEEVGRILISAMKKEQFVVVTHKPDLKFLKDVRGNDLEKLEKYLKKAIKKAG